MGKTGIKGVQQAGAPGELIIILLGAAGVGKIGGAYFRPVVARKLTVPVSPAQLILNIHPSLVRILLFISGGTKALSSTLTRRSGWPVDILLRAAGPTKILAYWKRRTKTT